MKENVFTPSLIGDYIEIFDCSQKEISELQNKCELLEKDAERYRFLRERDIDEIEKGGVFAGLTPDNLVLNGMDLDSAIDSAMATFERQKPTQPVVEVDKVVQKLNQDVFLQHDERYKFASVVSGKAQLMTHRPFENEDSFGSKYLCLPSYAFVKPLDGDFENTDLIIERVEVSK